MSLLIDMNDIIRATLDEDCGNQGFIGIAPDGGRYHVVVPVDRQIARGVKAGNHPMDGTPFGGYKGWHYFGCPGYQCPAGHPEGGRQKVRIKQAGDNARLLESWAAGRRIAVKIRPSVIE